MATKHAIYRDSVINVLANASKDTTPDEISEQILEEVENAIDMENAIRPKGKKWQNNLDRLRPAQIATILIERHNVKYLSFIDNCIEKEYCLPAIYVDEGDNEGIYSTDESVIRSVARQYCYDLTNNEYANVMTTLQDSAPRVTRCKNRDLIPLKNGVLDYQTKTLLDFSPDMVFTSKSPVEWNPSVTSPVFTRKDGSKWEFLEWIADLFEHDEEKVKLALQCMGAVLRPYNRFNMSAYWISESGNSGKGTLLEVCKQIVDGAYASIALYEFSKDFTCESLVKAQAILTDENPVSVYIDKSDIIKCISTGDSFQLTRKHKTNIGMFAFRGFMIQCCNDYPAVKDRSDSFYRRQLFLRFPKCFTGNDDEEIKSTYLHDKKVLEFIVHYLLTMPDYYKIEVPESSVEELDTYKINNDPIQEFYTEFLEDYDFQYDFLPYPFLYQLYVGWMRKTNPEGKLVKQKKFTSDLKKIVQKKPECIWVPLEQDERQRGSTYMKKPDLILLEYDELADWRNDRYSGSPDIMKQAELNPIKASKTYNGLKRKGCHTEEQ